MGASEKSDAEPFQEEKPPKREEEEPSPESEIHAESNTDVSNTDAKSKGRETIGGIKGTGIFSVPDGQDPTTKAARAEASKDLKEEEFSGYCGHCGRPMNVGRPEAKCMKCGMIVHQFCFDAHAVKNHRPEAVSVRIEHREGKYFAVIGKAEK